MGIYEFKEFESHEAALRWREKVINDKFDADLKPKLDAIAEYPANIIVMDIGRNIGPDIAAIFDDGNLLR